MYLVVDCNSRLVNFKGFGGSSVSFTLGGISEWAASGFDLPMVLYAETR